MSKQILDWGLLDLGVNFIDSWCININQVKVTHCICWEKDKQRYCSTPINGVQVSSQPRCLYIKYLEMECLDMEACIRISSLRLSSVRILKHSLYMIWYPDIFMSGYRDPNIKMSGYRNTALISGHPVIGVTLWYRIKINYLTQWIETKAIIKI